ncbi:MAG: hypothetical protein L0Z49_11220, partial [Actinobacteria bacterium]|nr:hypothetical protein [Actinomycetota bacterium]
MTDLLEAAASALGTPSALVKRSAAARAAVSGTTPEEILSAWAGGAPLAAAPATTVETPPAPPAPETTPAPLPEPVMAETQPPLPETPPPQILEPPIAAAEPLEPVPLGDRVRTAVRVGAWTGAGLGVLGFLIAGAFWAPLVTVLPDGGPPVVEVRSVMVLLGVALVSVAFGAVVAGLSRAAVSWRDPAMQLSGSRAATAWVGAALGLVLGAGAASLLTGVFGTPIEGDAGIVQLPVLATLGVMVLGGSGLGALTAGVPQLLGTPVAVDPEEVEEVATVRKRLGDAISIPVAGVVLLLFLVLPFAFALIESNHLLPNAAAVVAVITAGGILGFAALAGSRPHVRITFGELMVAVIGIGTVLLVLL